MTASVNRYYPQPARMVHFNQEGVCPYRIVAQAIFFDAYCQFFQDRLMVAITEEGVRLVEAEEE